MINYNDDNVSADGQGDGDNKEEKEEKLRNTEDYPLLVQ